MPESQNTEWKSKWKDEYLEWICGYANAQGGKIYIGCDDEGNVVGVSNARKLMEDIPNKIRDAISKSTCPHIPYVSRARVFTTIAVEVHGKFYPARLWKHS